MAQTLLNKLITNKDLREIKYFIFAFATIFVACSVGKQGVFYSEMSKKPSIETYNNKIVINTENSNKNSALLIYEIKYTMDTVDNVILLKGYQAAGKQNKNKFELEIKDKSKKQLDSFQFYWVDPDGNKNQIENIKN